MRDPSAPLVLVVDDDATVRRACVDLVTAGGYRAVEAASVAEGLRLFGERRPRAVVLDMKLPDGVGIDVLRELQRGAPGTPVVVVSGYASVTDAVEAMRIGATDFIEKPVTRQRLLEVLERALDAPLPGGAGEANRPADVSRYGMVGRSEAMRRVCQLVDMAAPTKCRVFISGESGTGKELVARAIHAASPRRARPFVELNCAAIPSELIESELFGYTRGAFTGATSDRKGLFEAADAGTLFLDEIGDMSLATQAKLLRVLQEGVITPVGSLESRPVDVRIVSATGKDLPAEIARGAFREDLFHRINVLSIALPPLRERGRDVIELAEHFLRLASVENGVPPKRLTPRARDLLQQLPWPGNVRELRNLMERLVVLVPHEDLSREDVLGMLQLRGAPPADDSPMPLRQARARFERQYILDRLVANSGNLITTARDLGIERTNLYRKMRRLGLSSRNVRQEARRRPA